MQIVCCFVFNPAPKKQHILEEKNVFHIYFLNKLFFFFAKGNFIKDISDVLLSHLFLNSTGLTPAAAYLESDGEFGADCPNAILVCLDQELRMDIRLPTTAFLLARQDTSSHIAQRLHLQSTTFVEDFKRWVFAGPTLILAAETRRHFCLLRSKLMREHNLAFWLVNFKLLLKVVTTARKPSGLTVKLIINIYMDRLPAYVSKLKSIFPSVL